jgi:3-oxoacyl-[acyl-carrier protein] reductase
VNDLQGKVAVVTGASSGVGAETARLLAGRGCAVAINFARRREAAEAVAAECATLGGEAMLAQGDVADDAACRRIVDDAVARWGRLDYLVNNAGTTKFVGHRNLAGLSAEDFQRIYAVNTIGAFQMVRAAEPHLRAARGSVVNVSSVAGVYASGSSLAYAASKAALNGLTLGLARVLGPEVRINAVCPGFIEGDWLRDGMGENAYEAGRRNWIENAPLGRPNTADDVAQNVVMFLTSAPNVTGEIFLVDAGMKLAQFRLPPRR